MRLLLLLVLSTITSTVWAQSAASVAAAGTLGAPAQSAALSSTGLGPDSTGHAATAQPLQKVELPEATADSAVAALGEPDTTRVTAPADSAQNRLVGLSSKQREKLGRTDAHQYYKPGPGPFWAGVGLGLLTTAGLATSTAPVSVVALGGVVATGVSGPAPARLAASNPQPQLLQDAAYHKGYLREARGKRLGQTTLGWGSATLASLAVLMYIILSALHHL